MKYQCLVLICAIVVLTGCGASDGRVPGKFEASVEMDFDRMENMMGQNGQAGQMRPPGMQGEWQDRMKARAAELANQKVTLEFKTDGTWESSFGTSSAGGPMSLAGQGTWEVISTDGDTVKLKLENESDPGREMTMVFQEDGSFTSDDFAGGGMMKVGRFEKVTAKSGSNE